MMEISRCFRLTLGHDLDGITCDHANVGGHGHEVLVEVVLHARHLPLPKQIGEPALWQPFRAHLDAVEQWDLSQVFGTTPTCARLALHLMTWCLGNLTVWCHCQIHTVEVRAGLSSWARCHDEHPAHLIHHDALEHP